MSRNYKQPKKNRQGLHGYNHKDKEMVESLDQLADFREFVQHVPKKLRNALLKGASAKDIYEQFSQDAAARAVLIAMTEKDASKALAAIKNIEDRVHGKPTEKRETTHRFDELPDEELDAILQSEMQDVSSEKSKH